MDKLDKRQRLKSESSDEEEDFESADEGEESKTSRPPPSLMATSPDDGKNSTLENQVTKDSSMEASSNMAETQAESSISSELPQGAEKHENSSENSEIHADGQSREENGPECTTNVETSKEFSDNAKDDSAQEQELSVENTKSLNDIEDNEIQFKSDEKVCDENPSELEKTQENVSADLDTTAKHKDTIDKDSVDIPGEEKSDGAESEEKDDKETPEESIPEQNPER